MTLEVIETEVENTDAVEAVEIEVEQYEDSELETMYKEMLDENGTVTIAGSEFDVSYAIQELDPTNYNCGLSDFESNTQEYNTMYKCPICGSEEFEDEDEAKFHCQEEYLTKFDVDGEIFDTEEEADNYLETLEDEE